MCTVSGRHIPCAYTGQTPNKIRPDLISPCIRKTDHTLRVQWQRSGALWRMRIPGVQPQTLSVKHHQTVMITLFLGGLLHNRTANISAKPPLPAAHGTVSPRERKARLVVSARPSSKPCSNPRRVTFASRRVHGTPPPRRILIWARARSRRLAPILMNKATVQYGTSWPGTASGIAPPAAVRTVVLLLVQSTGEKLLRPGEEGARSI